MVRRRRRPSAKVRGVRLWALTRRPTLMLAILAFLGLVTGALAAFAPSERLQFLPVLPVILLAWSLRSRDDAREVWTPRSPGALDSALLAVATLTYGATTVTAVAVLAPEQLVPHHFVLWGTFFSVGLLGLIATVSRLPTAATAVLVIQTTSFVVQYLFRPHGPVLAMISESSPPELAWPVSLATWAAGLAMVAASVRVRRSVSLSRSGR